MLSSLSFFFTEAVTNCRRAGMMTFITVSTIAVTLMLMGTFLLAAVTTEGFLHRLQQEALVTAFLPPTTPRDQVNALKLRLTQMDEVEQAEIIWPEAAMRELFTDSSDRELLQLGLGSESNPLPPTIRIKMRGSHDLQPLLARLKGLSPIESVSYGEEAYRQFQGLSELLWLGSLLVIILLGLASLFIVYNTVRLTLYMRREEIVIMKLVGATNWFIRWPFIIEGFIQGVAGSLLASILLMLSYKFILARLAVLVPFFAIQVGFAHLLKLSIKLLMMGVVLGISGSLLSLRDLNSFSRESS
ncbi:MAG TPA: permease-like cell division protein FtsX [Candidatus Ozemobacteraceae bacterium]|nr:permease-like cell division protein FtsX [Candidatus Ozemobacteraceae bacterium]